MPIPAPQARVRRVVTGHRADGKSYIVNDEVAPVNSIWTTTAEQLLGAPPQGEPTRITRDTGETRCFVATIQPSRDPKPDLTNRAGFHITPGIAYCLMLNGEIVLLTDTQEVKVRAGDVVVERNAFHSWRNESTEPVSMFIVTVNGAE
jgi:mannose-6-phosphate isomerase-like protein (cupin superfamily)